ncbi:MAG: N-acyl homoserine lactonase family protein [Alphaproteobacteria bacterium]|nr:N-acyl homoserine lactonase family protein [Alphaproteobacteria bacterium]
MTRWLKLKIALAALAAAPAATAAAPPADMALWRLDCGSVLVTDLDVFSDSFAYVGQKKTLTDSCYLIRHGGQYLLWDTGFPVELAGRSEVDGPFTASLGATLAAQLARIGVRPEQVTYVGVSHRHDDHTGQLPAFPKAILLIGAGDFETLKQRKSDRIAPWASGGGKVEPVTGDRDVFGDGSVVMLDMPGHTEAHHSLLVRLPQTGPVLLSGDLYHFTENRQSGGVPSFNTNRGQTMASMARFEAIARNLRAKVVIQHEPADVAKLPAFPAAAR